MTPRFSISKTWTALPVDFVSKVQKVFTDEFHAEATKGEFIVEGRIYKDEILVRLGYLEAGRLKQVNFEASMDITPGKGLLGIDLDKDLDKIEGAPLDLDGEMAAAAAAFDDDNDDDGDEFDIDEIEGREKRKSETATERLYACIDALGSMMEEYFEIGDDKQMDIPPTWRAYEFEGDTIYMQHNNINSKLEEEADRLLGLTGADLVHEEDETEDALRRSLIDSDLALEIQKSIRNGTYTGYRPPTEASPHGHPEESFDVSTETGNEH